MKAIFENPIKIKVDKKTNMAHLSIRSSAYKVEVFKISLGDIAHLVASFSSQMNTKDSHNGTKVAITGPEDDNMLNEENNNN